MGRRRKEISNSDRSTLVNYHRHSGSSVGARPRNIVSALTRKATRARWGVAEQEAKELKESEKLPTYDFDQSFYDAQTGEVVISMRNKEFNSFSLENHETINIIELTNLESEATNVSIYPAGMTFTTGNNDTFYPKGPMPTSVDTILPMYSKFLLSTSIEDGMAVVSSSPSLAHNERVKYRLMGSFSHGSSYAVIQNAANNNGTFSYFAFTYMIPSDFVYKADYRMMGSYDSSSKVISISLKNIGTLASQEANSYCWMNIFEVTDNVEDSNTIQNLPAGTALTTYRNGEVVTVYPKSIANYGITLNESSVTSISNSNITYTVFFGLKSGGSSYARFSPALAAGDEITFSFVGSNFVAGSKYVLTSDEILYHGTSRPGDTLEIVDDFDAPSNNFYHWVAGSNSN